MGFSSDIEDLQRRAKRATDLQVAAAPPTQERVAEPASPSTVGTGSSDAPDVADPED